MPERSEYPAGFPSWSDVSTDDIDATTAFYTELLGWTAQAAGPPEQTGGYGIFFKADKQIAGYGPAQGGPPGWATYFTVDDVDKTTALAKERGGTVLAEPMDVMDVGRMAVLGDPAGAAFSLWQPGLHHGAQLRDEPGAPCWTELSTTDPEAAAAFYGDVFGWTLRGDDETGYTEFDVGGEAAGGIMQLAPMAAEAGAPPHWLPYFVVDDCDTAVEKAKGLGAEVFVEPSDIPTVGRFAVIADPRGAVFAVIKIATVS